MTDQATTEVEAQEAPPSGETEAVTPEPTAEPESRSFSDIVTEMDDVFAEAAKAEGVDLDKPPVAAAVEEAVEAAEGDKTPEDESTPDPEPEAADLNYSLEGEEAEVKWSDGAALTFKADGQDVKVESVADLVTFAQKGVHADRKLSDMGRERSDALAQVDAIEADFKAKEIEWEEVLIAALTDEEKAEAMREKLGPLTNKEAREGARATAELEDRDKADDSRREADDVKAWSTMWGGYRDVTKEILDSGEGKENYPHLRDTDIPRIQQALYQASENYRGLMVKQLTESGKSDEEAGGIASAEAARWLTEDRSDALTRVLTAMNADYASRVSAPVKDDGESPNPDPSKADAARAHNERIDKKLRGREQQTLKGSGSTPSGTPPTNDDELRENETAYERSLRMIEAEFDKAKV